MSGFLKNITPVFAACSLLLAQSAGAIEYPIDVPEQASGMEIAAVYLQPIRMEPTGMMRPAEESDIHLEADIRALDINPNGFAEGEWVPYLHVKYELTKKDSDWKVAGDFMPMVANDGPHYGDNVKLNGPGKYHLVYTIHAPNAPENPQKGLLGRHTDRLTGVRPWFEAFTLEYDFIYSGIGKRGGY
ncbi:iron transporter [Marinobacter sp. SS8-8]|uniref:iron transporter n=1 Tax=Marinobacter sp. SS8-8 TaxID=3050452 RepID=UPI0026DF6417|nr:iron transporter [Marinobacter sp. SS8-8]|tara:strand:- start:37130 stop:37690 length:561 start_codon:yes stop_codon:yes gene_type:complete